MSKQKFDSINDAITHKKGSRELSYTPCVEKKAVAPPTPPILTPENIDRWINSIIELTNAIVAATPTKSGVTQGTHRVTRGNIDVIEFAAQLLSEHPAILSPAVDMNEWLLSIDILRTLQPLEDRIAVLENAIHNLNRAEAVIAFQDFMRQYRCIKILASEGVPEAMKLWEVMKVIYDHLRGRRGPQCGIKELKKAIVESNAVITEYEPLLLEVLNDQKRLERNLSHAIHQEDNIVDMK